MLPLGEKSFEISGGPVMDRYHGIINPSKIEWDQIPNKTPDQALNAMEQKRYSGFFFGGYFRLIPSVRFLGIFSKLRCGRLEDDA